MSDRCAVLREALEHMVFAAHRPNSEKSFGALANAEAVLLSTNDMGECENQRLRNALREAWELVHYEYCSFEHHPGCVAISGALGATSKSDGGVR